MLSMFSLTFWPFVWLWRSVCLGLLTIFFIVLFYFLILSYMSCLYILEINPLLLTSCASISSHSIGSCISIQPMLELLRKLMTLKCILRYGIYHWDFVIGETLLKMHLIMVINHIHVSSLYNFEVLQYTKSSGSMGFPSADSPTANYVSWISTWSWLNQKLQNPQILRIDYTMSHGHLQILVSAGIWENQTPMNTERQLYLRWSCMPMIPSFNWI